MGELLPEFWSAHKSEDERKDSKAPRSRKVMDIFTWLQCFGSYVAVLTVRDPHLIPVPRSSIPEYLFMTTLYHV